MIRRLMTAATLGLMFLIGPGFLAANSAEAHGVGYKESDLRPISLEFFYSTGELMSYLEAKVFSPSDERVAYQSGRTDEDGRFAFTPNKAGQWRVVVKDDEGHLAEATIDVTQEFLEGGAPDGDSGAVVQAKPAVPEGMDLYIRAGLGISILFNIAAFIKLARRKKAV